MRAALAPPAAALGSRARCSPPGAVSTGLRAPANWAMLWGWHGGPRGKDARAEGAEPPGVAREKERRGAGQGLPPRRAALRSGAPRSPAPPGALAPFTPRGDWSSGAWGAEGETQGGKVLLDLGPRRSLSRLPDLASQTPLHKPGIPSSCFWVRPARPRELGALSLWLREQHPVPVAAAGQGGRMSPPLWNRSFWRRSSKACRLSPRCRAG